MTDEITLERDADEILGVAGIVDEPDEDEGSSEDEEQDEDD